MAVYGIYSPIELLILGVYFNCSIQAFRAKGIGLIIGVAGVVVGIANSIFLQPLSGSNNYFLFFEGIVTISMVLFAFARIFIEEAEQSLSRSPHFWIGIALVFYWSITFCNWGLYEYLYAKHPKSGWLVGLSLELANLITYIIFIVVYLRYPKWVADNE